MWFIVNEIPINIDIYVCQVTYYMYNIKTKIVILIKFIVACGNDIGKCKKYTKNK